MAGYYGKDYVAPTETSSATYESTPVENNQLYDYTQQQAQDANNPYTDTASADTSSDDTSTKAEQPATTQPQATTEQGRAQEANNGQSYLDTAVQNITTWGTKNGLSAERINDLNQYQALSPENKQKVIAYAQANGKNDFLSDVTGWNQYSASLATQAQTAPTQQTAAPTQQQTQTAPAQNQLLPSAGGSKYQGDSIYDPTKTYGRQPDGSYVYSSSAAQLQRDLNRTMNAGLTVDGYFGEKTQQALDNYLAQYGKPTTPSSTELNASVPMSANGSMSQALAESAKAKPENAENAGTSKPSTTWEQIQRGWDRLWHGDNNNTTPEETQPNTATTNPSSPPSSVNNTDMARAEQRDARRIERERAAELERQAALNNIINGNTNLPESAPVMQVSNGNNQTPTLEEALTASRYNNGSLPLVETQPRTESNPINYAAMLDELNQMDRNDWYQRPESQPTTAEREPINYNAMADELAQMDRNDWYQRPESQTVEERQPIEYTDAFIKQENTKDAYSPYADYSGGRTTAELSTNATEDMAPDDIQSSSSNTGESDEAAAFRKAYEAAMNNGNSITQGFKAQTDNIYMDQFREDLSKMKQQFPSYSYSALADMVLFGEEMRNGQSSYYKWMAQNL